MKTNELYSKFSYQLQQLIHLIGTTIDIHYAKSNGDCSDYAKERGICTGFFLNSDGNIRVCYKTLKNEDKDIGIHQVPDVLKELHKFH